MKVCRICGQFIAPESRATKYCSPQCRARVKYLKDRAWLAAHPGKSAEYSRRYYEANRDKCLNEKRKAYRNTCLKQYSGNTDDA